MDSPRLIMDIGRTRERIGRQVKRLIGGDPVRLRTDDGSARFLLCDCTDAEAGALVRDKRHLQLVGGPSAPLVVDIDSLHPGGIQAASEAAFGSERLICATRLLDAMLSSHFGIQMSWFSSGKQGVHGFAFGTCLSKSMREAVVALLPGDESVFAHEAWSSAAVVDEVEAGLKHLVELDLSACNDVEWLGRLTKASNTEASLSTKLGAVTAFYDRGVTSGGQIRVPLAHNAKGCGYAGFPLPRAENVGTVWPPMKRLSTAPLLNSELLVLESIKLPTSEERKEVTQRLQANSHHSRKRALSEMEESGLRNWVPRLQPRSCSLPTNEAVRAALIQRPVRQALSSEVVRALERGMCRGGMPPCNWKPEPDDKYRLDCSTRGGGTGRSDLPLALEALAGLNLTADGRGSVARTLLISAFPVDCFAEALKCSSLVRRDVLAHWGSWFATLSQGRAKAGVAAWRYDGGYLDLIGLQCPAVLKQCARAASILLERAVSLRTTSHTPSGPTVANRETTGRVVTMVLTQSVAEQLELARPALQDRARREAGSEDTVSRRYEELLAHAEKDLHALHATATNGRISFTEYIAPEGRLGYTCAGYSSIKSVVRELRPVLFPGMWRVDIKRCHMSMLIGAHARAVSLDSAPDDPLLCRMRTDMHSLEADLRSEQQLLMIDARVRLERSRGTDEEKNASKYLSYLQMEPKTLLSVMLNHPNKSPMFLNWPLAAACCKAMGVAAAAARSHPLVAADSHRPELKGIKPGSPAEKQSLAFLLERRAVTTLVSVLDGPSITINDEVLFAAPVGDPVELERALMQELEQKLGFCIRITMGAL